MSLKGKKKGGPKKGSKHLTAKDIEALAPRAVELMMGGQSREVVAASLRLGIDQLRRVLKSQPYKRILLAAQDEQISDVQGKLGQAADEALHYLRSAVDTQSRGRITPYGVTAAKVLLERAEVRRTKAGQADVQDISDERILKLLRMFPRLCCLVADEYRAQSVDR